ncbi:MAG TPA: DUF2339 domain-containing protein [Baekduia sp.]|uniref:DUF2339 domain-containing protein n=1 Tax=Baekduia sp. TaxID=2600305 RepID=UPI002BF5136E|nr:DUF2339 domain-containing protein [Baekduia sp.]HMJ34385.1 DUF2339 domain-containing protein [Baekduia sp.]
MVVDEQRMDEIERHADDLEARLARVEAAVRQPARATATTTTGSRSLAAVHPDWAASAPAGPVPAHAAATERPTPAPAPERPVPAPATATALPRPRSAALTGASLEDLLGGRVLAWVGGAALLLGVAFFLAIAVSRGWLGEDARCVLAAAGALGLLAFGVRLRERGGPAEAALAAAGAAIGALDVTIVVATRAYDLFPATAGIALALAVGAGATVLAIRWRSQAVAALGILGGLLAPALAGATYDGATIALLLACAVPAAAVLIAQRWDRIALAAFAVTAPQLGLWLVRDPSSGAALAALGAFGVLTVVQAVGFELRTAAPGLRPASAFLLTLDALFLAGAGSAVALGHDQSAVAHLWLAGLAAAHLGVGMTTGRVPRVSRELRLLALSLGVVLADVAFAAAVSGVALPVGYAVGALAFAVLARALPERKADHLFVRAGLGGHVLLAAAHALTVDAPAGALIGGGASVDAGAAALALASVAAASFAGARVATLPREMRAALDLTALAAVAWLSAIVLAPVPLAIAWAAEGAALALVWRRSGEAVATGAAWAHLAMGTSVALILVAPPSAIVDGLDDPLGATAVLGALALALARCARTGLGGPDEDDERIVTGLLYGGAALTVLLLASELVVTPFDLHAGQVALSALWGVTGASALVAGLRLDRAIVRRAGLGLLLVTIGKVFLVDLATLDSAARAGSFLALGFLLLGAAFAWQRQRPAVGRAADVAA